MKINLGMPIPQQIEILTRELERLKGLNAFGLEFDVPDPVSTHMPLAERQQHVDTLVKNLTPETIRYLVVFTIDVAGAVTRAGCPSGVSIPGYIDHLAAERRARRG